MLLITVPGTLAANLVTAFVVFAGLAVLRHLEYPPCPPSIRAAPVCATLPYRPSWPAIWSVTGGGLLIAACIFGVYLGLAWIDRRQGRKHARWSTRAYLVFAAFVFGFVLLVWVGLASGFRPPGG